MTRKKRSSGARSSGGDIRRDSDTSPRQSPSAPSSASPNPLSPSPSPDLFSINPGTLLIGNVRRWYNLTVIVVSGVALGNVYRSLRRVCYHNDPNFGAIEPYVFIIFFGIIYFVWGLFEWYVNDNFILDFSSHGNQQSHPDNQQSHPDNE